MVFTGPQTLRGSELKATNKGHYRYPQLLLKALIQTIAESDTIREKVTCHHFERVIWPSLAVVVS